MWALRCLWAGPPRPGSMGKGYPGHRVTTIDDAGGECPVGVPGEVAVHRRSPYPEPVGQLDPIFMLGYWNKPDATLAKFTGSADGQLVPHRRHGGARCRWLPLVPRAGRRCVQGGGLPHRPPARSRTAQSKHPAVLNAAVVPKPDRERGTGQGLCGAVARLHGQPCTLGKERTARSMPTAVPRWWPSCKHTSGPGWPRMSTPRKSVCRNPAHDHHRQSPAAHPAFAGRRARPRRQP